MIWWILSTFGFGIVGPILGLALLVFGIICFVIATQEIDRNKKVASRAARRAFTLWAVSVLWTVLWVWMLIVSIINWVAAAA